MRKKLVATCLGLCVFLTFSACSSKLPASTNLTGVMLDGVTIGYTLDDIDSEKYTLSDRFPEQPGKVNYEEWKITADESDFITKIHANFSDIQISVNETSNLQTIDKVIDILGENYATSWYDREQHLKQAKYVDRENGLLCCFIYDSMNNQLIWLVMEKSL